MQTAVIGAGLAGLNGARLPQPQDNIDNKPT
jgi:protoporphyrinogen oxidase